MNRTLSLILVPLVISACATTTESGLPANAPTIAPIVAAPTLPSSVTPRPTLSSGPSSTPPAAGMASSPAIVSLTATAWATAPKPSGWRTYVNGHLQVALDYPLDWTVREQATGVTFTSPQGVEILLAPVETDSLSPEDYLTETQLPNTRCTSDSNAHRVAVRVCFDTISFSYTAFLTVQPATGMRRLLLLSTRSRASLQLFNTMVESAQTAP